MERKVLDIADLKLKDDGAGSFSGYASTFGNWDSVRERPVRGAFAKHLPDFLKDGFIALGHDWSGLPIATPTDAYEDEIGLRIDVDYHTTAAAQAARTTVKERIERGKSVKLSIGYEVLADEYTEEGRLLKEIKLYEVSLVTVPANQQAIVLGAKSGGVPSGLNDHISEVVSALDVLAGRVRDRHDFRKKEGRMLSSANRTKIEELLPSLMSVHDALNELLTASEPKASEEGAKQAFMEYLRLEAHLNGVR